MQKKDRNEEKVKVLIFEWKNFGVEDVCEALDKLNISYRCISTQLVRERKSGEFDNIFEDALAERFDCVYTFNYSPVVSNCCRRHNLPYIAFIYDSPLVSLYSYTVINPCNYIFIFDKTLYLELKNQGINTVYYAPLAVNTDRIKRQLSTIGEAHSLRGGKPAEAHFMSGDAPAEVAFVGSMYNEKHNLFDRFKNLPPFVSGYLDAIMQAQLKVYGYYFIEELLTPNIIEELKKSVPVEPNKDGVETVSYLYAYYFIARKLAELERKDLIGAVSERFSTHVYTQNPTPELPKAKNCGPIDYYNDMPYIFSQSKINLNITLRSIRSGIPLRAMDIMGCGGFLMSNYQADFYDFFVPGEDLILYESKDDLLDKCAYYLSHDNERRQIAANGLGRIEENHTYELRLKQMFDIVFN